MGIKCMCKTNLDLYAREEWPISLAAVPRVGDRVAARSGRHLRVVEVIFHGPTSEHDPQGEWVEIELNR